MEQGATEATIFEVASRCSDLFKDYLDSPVYIQKHVAQELRSRFNLWATYTGAFADHGMSLDDRLIFHQDVKRMVLKLLYMVQRNIQDGAYFVY